MNTFGLSLTCASLVLLAGCADEQYGRHDTAAYSGDVISSPSQYSSIPPTTEGIGAGDSTLASEIRQALNTSGVAADSHYINVIAQNGNVTLTGSVPNDSERRQVDDLVRNIQGVSTVYDQMQIAPAATTSTQVYEPAYGSSVQPVTPTGRPEPTGYANTMVSGDIFNLHVQGLNETDRTMAERILHGLRTDTTLSSLLPVVNITVMNGKIVLQGAVQNEQQRRTIASVIQRAAGAADVENDLQVVGP